MSPMIAYIDSNENSRQEYYYSRYSHAEEVKYDEELLKEELLPRIIIGDTYSRPVLWFKRMDH